MRIVPLAADHDLGRGAVVAGKEHERVVDHTHRCELRENPADLLVQAVDHRRMDRHLVDLKVSLRGREVLPRKRPVHLTCPEDLKRVGLVIRRADLSFHRRRGGRHDALRLQPGNPGLLHGIPPGPVAVAVFGDEFRRCVQRKMGRRKGHIVEKRCSRVVPRVIGEALHGVVADRRRGVVIIADWHLLAVLDDACGGKIVVVPLRHVERPRKALRPRVAVDMPLAGVIRPIAGRCEQLRQEPRPSGPRSLPLPAFRQGIAADRLRVVAGEQCPTGRPAAGRVVALREPQAAGGQAIKMGRIDLAAVAAQVGKAEVVGQDHDHVWRRGLRNGHRHHHHKERRRHAPEGNTTRRDQHAHGATPHGRVCRRSSASSDCTVAACAGSSARFTSSRGSVSWS